MTDPIRLTWSSSKAEALVTNAATIERFEALSDGEAQRKRRGRRMFDTWATLAEPGGYEGKADEQAEAPGENRYA